MAARILGEIGDEVALEREEALGSAVEAQPGLGRLDPAAGAVEELRAEPLLEGAHLEPDGRLGHPEPLRCLGERRRSTTAQNAGSWLVSTRPAPPHEESL